MRDYYAEFLKRKNSGNIQVSEVSKVSKGQNPVKKQAFDTFDTSLPDNNQKNFAEFYNAKLEKVLSDEKLFDNFETILDEQKAILMIGGGLPETQAERQIMNFENLRQIVLSV